MNEVLAVMSEGALYCASCAVYDDEDVEQSHVIPITKFDLMVGEGVAQWLDNEPTCSGCGTDLG